MIKTALATMINEKFLLSYNLKLLNKLILLFSFLVFFVVVIIILIITLVFSQAMYYIIRKKQRREILKLEKKISELINILSDEMLRVKLESFGLPKHEARGWLQIE